MTSLFLFHDPNLQMIAALNYIIEKYGEEKWLGGILNQAVTSHLMNENHKLGTASRNENGLNPLGFIKNSREIRLLSQNYWRGKSRSDPMLEGCHYIIQRVETYNSILKNMRIFRVVSLVSFTMLLIAALVLFISIHFKRQLFHQFWPQIKSKEFVPVL